MKADLDRLMKARSLQAAMVTGDAEYVPARHYLTNGAHITGGIVLKKLGSEPVLVVNPMEVEEAATSGLTVYTYNDFDWAKLLEETQGSRTKAEIAMVARLLEKLEVPPGKIGIYGTGSLNVYIEYVTLLRAALPGYEVVGEIGMDLFTEAYVTKGADEMAMIKAVAAATSEVWQATWDFIGGHRAEGEIVVRDDGTPLTIGDVKNFVRRALMDRGLEDTGMIFAQGRDGAFPHSRGQADMALRLGQAIVFDLFPRQRGGGYYHDSTRTWCIGYAPDDVRQTYNTVMRAFQTAVETFAEPGQPAHTLQDAVLDYFEAEGHPTLRSDPKTMDGYVHGLGHGVGLNIHERPSMSHMVKEDILQIGNLLTIEPGLYYPERGYGVRIEDAFVIDETGALVALTNFHKELVLPLKG